MELSRNNALRLSTLSHFTCQLACHYRELAELGQPSLTRLADEVVCQLTAEERDRVQAEAATDYYVWGIAAGADVTTVLAARAIGWLEFWDSLPWGQRLLAGLDVEQVARATAAGADLDTVGWIDPAVQTLLVDAHKAVRERITDMARIIDML